jgi:hypothetical protein
MTDGERSFKEKLALQIALRRIDAIFEECSKFEERDRKILFEAIRSLLLHKYSLTETPARTDEAPLQLADTAPTDGIREALSNIADLCEAELKLVEHTVPCPQ